MAFALVCALSLAVFVASAAFGGSGASSASASEGQPNGTCGVCVLASSGESLKLTGSGGVTLTKANMIVNSSAKPALALTGSAILSAPSVGVAGTASITGSGTIKNLTTGITPVANPLEGLAAPSLSVPK